MKRVTMLLSLLLRLTLTGLQAQESLLPGENGGPLSIAWEAVDGAAAYRVEVRLADTVFIDTETDATTLKLNLAPGTYEYRVRVLDPFGNEAAATGWVPLKVQRALTPYFRITNPQTVWEGDGETRPTADVIGIRDNLVFTLSDGRRSVVLETEATPEGLVMPLSLAGLEPGEWGITATAPSGYSFTHPGALIIRPTRPPEIGSIDTLRTDAEGLRPIIISGESFDREMTVAFKGPGGYLEVAAVEVSDGREATAYVNLEGAEEGEYDLILTNPAGEETVRKNSLLVNAPETVEEPRIQPRFEFHVGWAPSYVKVPYDEYSLFSLATFETALAFQSGWTAPFVRGLGVEARIFYGISNSINLVESGTSVDYVVKADLSGYWRPTVRGRIAPVLILGFGNMWSGFAAGFGLENMLFTRYGLGMDFSTFTRFTRIGITMEIGYSSDEIVPMFSLMFRRGFRF